MKFTNEVLPGVEEVIDDFYHGQGVKFTQYSKSPGHTGVIESETPGLLAPEWIQDEQNVKEFFERVDHNLDIVNETLGVEEQGDDSFEIAHISSDSEKPKGTMLHISTYSSSISTNPGNAFEFAVQAALYPDLNHVYVASPGNGGSSPIKNIDMKINTPHGVMDQLEYFAKTGRTTYEDGDEIKPLPYLVNMQRALDKRGLAVTGFIGTDSAGGSYATGLTLAMEADQIDYGLFSERSNFAALNRVELIYGMIVTENIRHGKRMGMVTLGSGQIIDPISVHAPRAYLEPREDNKKSEKNSSLAKERVHPKRIVKAKGHMGAMVTSLAALSNGRDLRSKVYDPTQDPVVLDTNAMIARHPNGSFTFTLAEHDPLYIGQADELARHLLKKADSNSATVQAMILRSLPHAYHTHLPLLQDAIRRVAFDYDLAA